MVTESAFTPAERLQSLMAAGVAGLGSGGAAAALLLLHRAQEVGWAAAVAAVATLGLSGLGFWVSTAIAAVSGSLFGITYRYAVRRDRNPQLRAGVVLAFSVVRGLAQVDVGSAFSLGGWPFMVSLSESLIVFAAAVALLEGALHSGWIKPFFAD